jgi:hypothetical protein
MIMILLTCVGDSILIKVQYCVICSFLNVVKSSGIYGGRCLVTNVS